MKKILIISHWYYPHNVPRAFRAKALYEDLINKGHDVDLLIGNQKVFLKKDEYDLEKFEIPKKSNTLNKKFKGRLFEKIKEIIFYFIGDRFLFTSGKHIYKNIDFENYDGVISLGLPFYINFITALKKKLTKSNTTLITEWSDPFYGTKDIKIAPYFNYIQKKVCSISSYVVIPTIAALPYFLKYKDEKKIKIIPQAFDFSNIKISDYKKNEVPTFGFAGLFYKDIRNPEKLLESLSSIDIPFKFVVYTVTRGRIFDEVLLKYKNILGDKLEISSLIPREDCLKKLSEMEFLINIDNLSSNQVPSKLIDYALTKRPILSFKQDEIDIEILKSFIDGVYDNSLYLDIEKYNIKHRSNDFLELI
ncbi:hypothetical protein A0126_12835 [Exiguobacterium sp. N4-1P]|uniref:hypothetical protein n=1 Tax=Exiguobacterium sp. N4-1P TaxID=2051906 RepID=UPI000B5975C1|nr:hypothetical protein [Exiguobacterium sp. N4-1P]ASI36432.1 hypothetical protein A0126_12835 [Exiguobacterium sp. N4-1P]